ncbi:MAG: AI-2E family transporter [Candidatus Kerfeldbacteria bacterium]|nr:AI-2E family transporter [Candidatus Kerfeldbacteria bacterium]
MSPDRTTTIDVTTGTILKFFLLLVAILFLWTIRSVVIIVFFSIIIASAITPMVDALHRRRVPRGLGIALAYLLVVAVLVLVVVLFGQLVSDQVRELAANFPSYYDRAVDFLFGSSQVSPAIAERIQGWLQSLNVTILRLTSQVATGAIGLFGGVFAFFGVLIMSFYMVAQKDSLKKLADTLAPVNLLPYLYQLLDRIQKRLGGWVRGQLLLSLIIGSMSYIGLLIFGVDYALALALIAGLSELVPVAGPIIGAVPAVFVAFGQSPLLAGGVALLYLVIQQLENSLIVPKVMQRTTGLNPVVTIIVMLVGATLAGFAGVVLAIPLTLIVDSFLEDFFKEDNGAESADQPASDA